MMNFLQENWISLLSNFGLAVGWIFDRNKLKRSQALLDDSQSIANLKEIISQQNDYINNLNKRMGEIETHFDNKCAEMQEELETLKKKIT